MKKNDESSKQQNNTSARTKDALPLECKGITKRYGGRSKAVNSVDLTVKKGHIAALLGPEGAGKTTVAKAICGLTSINEGSILIGGKPLNLNNVSYQPEYPYVNSKQRVGDLVEMYRAFYNDFDAKRAIAAFKRIEVSLNDKFYYLSRSSIQRVETVLTMSRHTKLYVLDEPIAGVEPKSRDFVIKTILNASNNDNGILVCSALASQLEKILDEVYIIYKGEIKLVSSADEIMQEYGTTVSGFYREAFKC